MAAIRSLAYGRQQQLGLRAARKGIPAYRRELREAGTIRGPSPALLRATLGPADGRYALGVKKRQARRSGRLVAHFPAILLGWPACDSALRADPDRDVGGFQGLVYGSGQVVL